MYKGERPETTVTDINVRRQEDQAKDRLAHQITRLHEDAVAILAYENRQRLIQSPTLTDFIHMDVATDVFARGADEGKSKHADQLTDNYRRTYPHRHLIGDTSLPDAGDEAAGPNRAEPSWVDSFRTFITNHDSKIHAETALEALQHVAQGTRETTIQDVKTAVEAFKRTPGAKYQTLAELKESVAQEVAEAHCWAIDIGDPRKALQCAKIYEAVGYPEQDKFMRQGAIAAKIFTDLVISNKHRVPSKKDTEELRTVSIELREAYESHGIPQIDPASLRAMKTRMLLVFAENTPANFSGVTRNIINACGMEEHIRKTVKPPTAAEEQSASPTNDWGRDMATKLPSFHVNPEDAGVVVVPLTVDEMQKHRRAANWARGAAAGTLAVTVVTGAATAASASTPGETSRPSTTSVSQVMDPDGRIKTIKLNMGLPKDAGTPLKEATVTPTAEVLTVAKPDSKPTRIVQLFQRMTGKSGAPLQAPDAMALDSASGIQQGSPILESLNPTADGTVQPAPTVKPTEPLVATPVNFVGGEAIGGAGAEAAVFTPTQVEQAQQTSETMKNSIWNVELQADGLIASEQTLVHASPRSNAMTADMETYVQIREKVGKLNKKESVLPMAYASLIAQMPESWTQRVTTEVQNYVDALPVSSEAHRKLLKTYIEKEKVKLLKLNSFRTTAEEYTAEQQDAIATLKIVSDLWDMDSTEVGAILNAEQAIVNKLAAAQAAERAEAAQAAAAAAAAKRAAEAGSKTPEVATGVQRWVNATARAAKDNKWSQNKTEFLVLAVQEVMKAGGDINTLSGVGANVYGESGYDMNRVEGQNGYASDGEGYGYGQWSFGRKQNYLKKANAAGVNAKTENPAHAQFGVRFIVDESQGRTQRDGSGNEWKGMIAIKDPVAAAAYFQWNYERPVHETLEKKRATEAARIKSQIMAADKKIQAEIKQAADARKTAEARKQKAAKSSPFKITGEAKTPIHDGPSRTERGIVWGDPFEPSVMAKVGLSSAYHDYSAGFVRDHSGVEQHDGNDFVIDGKPGAIKGEKVLSVADGVVIQAGRYSQTEGGKKIFVVVVYHGMWNGKQQFTNYEHVDPRIPVEEGQIVKRGQEIAIASDSGTDGAHTHITYTDNDDTDKQGNGDGKVGVQDPNLLKKTASIVNFIPSGDRLKADYDWKNKKNAKL